DGIHNGVGVQLIAKSLRRGPQVWIFACSRVSRKNGCPGETEQMIFAEVFCNGKVHVAKLAAMAFIKDNHHMLVENGMPGVLFDKGRELLNGGDNDLYAVCFQLTLEDGS